MNKTRGGCDKLSSRNNITPCLKLEGAPISGRKWGPRRIANTQTKTVVLAGNHLNAQLQRYALFLEVFRSMLDPTPQKRDDGP
jgi:hypothetical protein